MIVTCALAPAPAPPPQVTLVFGRFGSARQLPDEHDNCDLPMSWAFRQTLMNAPVPLKLGAPSGKVARPQGGGVPAVGAPDVAPFATQMCREHGWAGRYAPPRPVALQRSERDPNSVPPKITAFVILAPVMVVVVLPVTMEVPVVRMAVANVPIRVIAIVAVGMFLMWLSSMRTVAVPMASVSTRRYRQTSRPVRCSCRTDASLRRCRPD